ncbi:hypothetical protein AGMMS49574_17440 [Bacteroidia bacterium]|nr:hypothetical protein AGMMS49574_17440 [Bacteroidia bacterium]
MKMKNYFKFLSVAALAAAGLVGCSTSEVVPPDVIDPTGPNQPQVALTDPTYATFQIFADDAAFTRVSEFPRDPGSESVTINRLRLIIFDGVNDGAKLEKNELLAFGTPGANGAKTATVKVNSGNKKLFLIANETTTGTEPIGAALDRLTVGITTLATFRDSANLWDLAGGNGNWTAGNAYGSVPVYLRQNADPTTLPTGTGIGSLITPSFIFTNAFADSSSTKTLKASIDSLQSLQANGNVPDLNHFAIYVKRLVAKAATIYTGGDSVTTDGRGKLSNIEYTYRNVNRGVQIFDRIGGGTRQEWPVSAYYGNLDIPSYIGVVPAPKDPIYPHYWWRSGTYSAQWDVIAKGTTNPSANGIITTGMGVGAHYNYLTENQVNHDAGKTHVALKAKYSPIVPGTSDLDSIIAGKDYGTASSGNPLGLDRFSFNSTLGTFGGIIKVPYSLVNTVNGGTFWRVRSNYRTATSVVINDPITGTNPTGTAVVQAFPKDVLYADSVLAYKVHWLNSHTDLTGFTIVPNDTVQKYTNGLTYYRVNIRQKGTFNSNDPATYDDEYVLRNVAYQIGIKSFSDLGSPSLEDLDNDSGRGNNPTYVTAEIYVIPWKDAVSDTNVDPYWP